MKAGFPGLELQVTLRSANSMNAIGIAPAFDGNLTVTVHELGFDSVTHYRFCYFTRMAGDHLTVLEAVKIK